MRSLSIVLAVGLLGCGSSTGLTQVKANTFYFWKVTSSTVVFGTCSDNADFRASLPALEFTDKTYFAYRVDSTGKKATIQTCDTRDESTCKPGTVVFDVTGSQLIATAQMKDLITGTTCSTLDQTTTTASDMGNTANLEIAHTFSLVDDQAACDKVESDFKAQSPNMLGIQGCVVTFKLGLTKG